jgi:polysaccharide pyruvyl transferase WcaK-like protein
MNLLLCGYYGYRNWGDEAALVVLVERLRQMQGRISLPSLVIHRLPSG